MDLVIVGGARTAMAEYAGTPGFGHFKDVSAIDLGAAAAKAALERAGVSGADVDHVIFGNAQQTSKDAIYGARHVALKAGCPITTPAVTVNRLCGSGIESIVQVGHRILLGEAKVALAGGMENMSQAPHVIRGLRGGLRFGTSPPLEDSLFEGLRDPMCGLFMAQTAEKLATKYAITREAQDEFAYRSHKLGIEAIDSGIFKEEIVPITVGKGRRERIVDLDDHIKRDTSFEILGKLRAAFGKDGTVTAGNASGIVDGAACVVVTSADEARARELDVKAVIRGWTVCGVDPEIMGIGPAPAIRQLLAKTNLTLDQIDRFEINEAFSAQYLAVERDLELDRDKVNVNGGAIALGHPLGATGTRLVLTLIHELSRSKTRYGIASACIGGGQGIAILIERP